VSSATINRFFSLHFTLPFILAALVAGHLLYLHISGSSNPAGTTSNTDRSAFHPYFSFKLRRMSLFIMILQIHFFSIEMKSLYLGSVGNHLPNRACTEKEYITQKQLCKDTLDNVDMVKVILPEDQFPLLSSEEGCPDCVGISSFNCGIGFEDSAKEIKWLSCVKYIIKEMSDRPKSTVCINKWTTGGLREGIPIAYRGSRVADFRLIHKLTGKYVSLKDGRKWSDPAKLQFSQFSTATGSGKNVLKKLDDLKNYSNNNPNKVIDRDLYKSFLLDPTMYLASYKKLRSKPGSMTPGINPTTLDGMSLDEILKIIDSLKDQSFKFTPGRLQSIPKKSGGTRPLVVGNPRDKLVQEVIRMVLEAIYEPLFFENSHGFRVNRSCHSALRYIFTKFTGTTWWIEGDIQKCFDSIPHDKLMRLLENKITDQRFLELIRKALNAGYFDFKTHITNIVGTPQGSIISPILANIFLHQLDKFVLTLKENFDSEDTNRNLKTSEYWKAKYELDKAKKLGFKGKELRRLVVAFRSTQPKLNDARTQRLEYVRYADDWIIAINGSFTQANNILNQITEYCVTIGLTVSPTKTKLTNSYKDKIFFLGTHIRHAIHRTYSKHTRGVLQRNRQSLLLTAPMNLIKRKLASARIAINNRGISKTMWTPLTLRQIVHNYNCVTRGFDNYYSFVQNKGTFSSWLYYVIWDSCLRTIAHKLSLGRRVKVIKRFGKDITVKVQTKQTEGKIITKQMKLFKPSYKLNVWDFKGYVKTNLPQMSYSEGISLATLDKLICSVCDSSYRVEMHHVRMMRDLSPRTKSLDALMAKVNRKQIPLCRSCHMKYHDNKLIISKAPINDFNEN
jgi:group II intron reverse transcriptase/maturase